MIWRVFARAWEPSEKCRRLAYTYIFILFCVLLFLVTVKRFTFLYLPFSITSSENGNHHGKDYDRNNTNSNNDNDKTPVEIRYCTYKESLQFSMFDLLNGSWKKMNESRRQTTFSMYNQFNCPQEFLIDPHDPNYDRPGISTYISNEKWDGNMKDDSNTSYSCMDSSLNALTYEWIPNNSSKCKINHLFNISEFLLKMTNKSILFIGDSITEQHFMSLVCRSNYNYSLRITVEHEIGNDKCLTIFDESITQYIYNQLILTPPEKQQICDLWIVKIKKYNVSLIYNRNNFLLSRYAVLINQNFTKQMDKDDDVETKIRDIALERYNAFWKDYLMDHLTNDLKLFDVNKDIILFNFGSHLYNQTFVQIGAYTFLDTMKKMFNGTIIFRSNIHGHPHCNNCTSPWTFDELKQKKSKAYMYYNWYEFDKYNDIIVDQLKKIYPRQNNINSSLLGGCDYCDWQYNMENNDSVIKVMNLSFFSSMSLGHPFGFSHKMGKDCLHYCIPGPIYWWNVQLFHILV